MDINEEKAENTPAGGVLVGKRDGQTIIHDKGTMSGYLVGKLHKDGGIKAVNKATGQPLEMQGGEIVITAPAVADTTKREFEGKMMTNREILSKINSDGGGVSFADGGDIPAKIHTTDCEYKFGGKVVKDTDIAHSLGMNSTLKKGKQHFSSGDTTYDVDAIYNAIKKGKLRLKTKEVETFPMKYPVYDKHYAENHKIDFRKPNGITVRTESGEEVLIDGNHRMNNAYSKGRKTMKTYYIEDPKQIAKFTKKNKFELGGENKTGGHLSSGKSLKQIAEMHNVSLAHINEQLAKGLEVEKEHFADFKERTRVAKDHLVENPNYYTILEKAGLKDGGHLRPHHKKGEDLVKDAKDGNTPARDLNNYNDLLDVQADGQVGGDSGIEMDGALVTGDAGAVDAFAKGGIFPRVNHSDKLGKEFVYQGGKFLIVDFPNKQGSWNKGARFRGKTASHHTYLIKLDEVKTDMDKNLFMKFEIPYFYNSDLDYWENFVGLPSVNSKGTVSKFLEDRFFNFFPEDVKLANGGEVNDNLWQSVKDKFSQVFWEEDDGDEIYANEVKAEERVWIFDRYSPYMGRVSWEDAKSMFLKSLTDEEKKIVNIEYNLREVSEAFGLMWEKKILVKRKKKIEEVDDLSELLEMVKSGNYANGGLTPYDANQEGDSFPVLSTGGGVEPIKVEKIIISQDLRRDKGYSRFVKKEFTDFQSFKNALKELVEEEDKKIPNAVNNGGFLIRINEDSGDSPYFWFEFNNKQKNTVSKFNPSTGKVSDFEKQLKKKRPKVFNSLNWSEFFGLGSKAPASTSAQPLNLSNTKVWLGEDYKQNLDLIKKIQEKAFELGWGWGYKGEDKIVNDKIGAQAFYFDEYNVITYSSGISGRSFYELNNGKELTPEQILGIPTTNSNSKKTIVPKFVEQIEVKYLDKDGNTIRSNMTYDAKELYEKLADLRKNGFGDVSVTPLGKNIGGKPKYVPISNNIWEYNLYTLTEDEGRLYTMNTISSDFPDLDFSKFRVLKTLNPISKKPIIEYVTVKDKLLFPYGQNVYRGSGLLPLFKSIYENSLNKFAEVELDVVINGIPNNLPFNLKLVDVVGYDWQMNPMEITEQELENKIKNDWLSEYDWETYFHTPQVDYINVFSVENSQFLGRYNNVSEFLSEISSAGFNYNQVLIQVNGIVTNYSNEFLYINNGSKVPNIDTNNDFYEDVIEDLEHIYPTYDWSKFGLSYMNNYGANEVMYFRLEYGSKAIFCNNPNELFVAIRDAEKLSVENSKPILCKIYSIQKSEHGYTFDRNDHLSIEDGFITKISDNYGKDFLRKWLENLFSWANEFLVDKFFEEKAQTPTLNTVVPKIVETGVYDLSSAISKLEKASSSVVTEYNKEIYDQSLKFLYDTKATYELALKFTPESAFMYERLDILKKVADIEKQIKNIEDMKKGGTFYMLAKILEKLERGESWKLLEQSQDVITNQIPQSEIDIIIRSQKFKNWFGDWEKALINDEFDNVSKALTNGIPSVYHHGARRIKYTYREVSNGVLYLAENVSYAIWFSQNATAQTEEGNYLTECFVNIKNPIDLTAFHVNRVDLGDIVRYVDAIYPLAKIYDFIPAQVALLIKTNQPTNVVMWAWQLIRSYAKFVNHIKENTPYDGFLYYENNPSDQVVNPTTGQSEENVTKAVAIFKSHQVKVVDAVLFDGGLDDWRFENGGKIKN
jgi:hypothetical protein